MPAPSIEYQLWPSASYSGFGTASTDFWPSLEAKIDAWITAISSNASIVADGALPIKRKGYADTTDAANRMGVVIELPRTGISSFYYYGVTLNSTIRYAYVNTGWTDNGTNGGYGSPTVGDNTGTTYSWATSGQDMGIIIAQDTTDGQEMFMAATAGTSTSQEGSLFTAVRTLGGGWASILNSSATSSVCMWHNETAGTVARDLNLIEDGNRFTPLVAQDLYSTPGIGPGYAMLPANPRVLSIGQSSRTGAYFGNGTNSVYQLWYYGPRVVI